MSTDKYIATTCDRCSKALSIRADSFKRRGGVCRCSNCVQQTRPPVRPRPRTGTMRACPSCSTLFYAPPSGENRFCSVACWRASIQVEDRDCAECGVTFQIRSSTLKTNATGRYCSLQCRNIAYIGRYRGQRVTSDPHRRTGWTRLRRAFVKANNNFCNWCGGERDGDLEVHHLVACRIVADHRHDNLVSLCAACHLVFGRLTERVALLPLARQQRIMLIVKAHLQDRWHYHQGMQIRLERHETCHGGA